MPFQFNFYVTSRGQSLLGVDFFDALKGSIQLGDITIASEMASSLFPVAAIDNADSSLMMTSTVSLDKFPLLLTRQDTLRGFVHKPMIDLSVKPVQHKFWHPPLAMREPIENELNRLELEGVI
jgi:hypothetical protein